MSRRNAQNARFERKRRGYDPEAVDVYIERLTSSHDDLRYEHEKLTARLAELEHEIERYRGLEQRVGNAMLLAESACITVRDKAAAQSEEILEQARRQAEEIVGGSRSERDRLLDEVEWLRALRTELVSSYKAFLVSALEVVEEHRLDEPVEEHPAGEPAVHQPDPSEEAAGSKRAVLSRSSRLEETA
jgi:cell division initiation protein